jgi:hypothetical protein
MAFDLRKYISIHLAYELKFLLVAAATWTAREHHGENRPDHLAVMAMDSAFVHARVLYEFLTREPRSGWETKRTPHDAVASDLWAEYSAPMHDKVLHPSPKRPYRPTGTTADDLHGQVLNLSRDVLRLWKGVAAQSVMEPYRVAMHAAAETAVQEAANAAERLRAPAVSWSD